MRLNRLRLKDFRGTVERELVFPAAGVVVVEGANEVGKTSLLEALDLLLTEKDTSSKTAVRAVKPVGRDAGSEVEAELSCGPYRFTYRKRWHRSTETVLTIHEPRSEQLTGVPAHERVRQILADTLDEPLWKALRMMQAAPLSQVPLSGSGALTAALDAAAGEVHDGGRSDSLVEAVEREYLQLHTATGRPTGALRAARETLDDARQRAEAAERAVEEAARDVERHAVLSAELVSLDADRAAAAREAGDLGARWDAAEELRSRADEAGRALVDARREHERVRHERDVRVELVADESRRAASVASLAAAVAVQEEAAASTAELLADHEGRRRALESRVTATAEAAQTAQAAADRLHDRTELERLQRRLDRVEALARRVEESRLAVAKAPVDAAALRGAEEAAAAVELALARRSGAAARVVLEPLTGLRLTVDGAEVELAAGERREVPVADQVEVVLPNLLRVGVLPGAAGGDLGASVREAQQVLAARLAEAGVPDLQEARRLHEQRRLADTELALSRRQLADELGRDEVGADEVGADGLGSDGLGPDGLGRNAVERLRRRARDLRGRLRLDTDVVTDADPDAADDAAEGATGGAAIREAARSAQREHTAARAALDAAEAAGAGCRDQLTAQQVELARAQSALQAAEAELADVRTRLAAARGGAADDVLGSRVEQAAALVAAAADEQARLDRQLREADAISLRSRLDNARAVLVRLDHDLAGRQQELAGVTARLEVVGSLGRQQLLDDARTALAAAEREAARLTARAQAATMLRDTLLRHREQSRRQYVAPYQEQVTRLGRIVFGPDFAVDVDNELRIVSRTRAGTTVPFDALSSGAKEQLGIIARLACAAIVEQDDGVPVLVDDALGYSDPERLRRVGAVLSVAAASAQVIVLTCTPDRYRSVGSAHVISLRDDGRPRQDEQPLLTG